MDQYPVANLNFPNPPRRWPWVAGAGVLAVLTFAGWNVLGSDDSTPSQAGSSPSATATSSANTPTTPDPSASASQGSTIPVIPPASISLVEMSQALQVGQDITTGVYRSQATDGSCSWARVGGTDQVLASATSPGQAVVSVMEGDGQLRSSGCGDWTPVTVPRIVTSFGGGDVIVGTDIAAGTFTAQAPGPQCRWQRTERTLAGVVSVAQSGTSSAQAVQVAVAPGDFVFSSVDCGTWQAAGVQPVAPTATM